MKIMMSIMNTKNVHAYLKSEGKQLYEITYPNAKQLMENSNGAQEMKKRYENTSMT